VEENLCPWLITDLTPLALIHDPMWLISPNLLSSWKYRLTPVYSALSRPVLSSLNVLGSFKKGCFSLGVFLDMALAWPFYLRFEMLD
jgi:hypothetical protein